MLRSYLFVSSLQLYFSSPSAQGFTQAPSFPDDCHRLKEETPCSSAQPLVVSQAGRGVVPLSRAQRDESQSLSSFSPLPGNGSPLGRVQAFAGKELSTVLTGRGWMRDASGDPGRSREPRGDLTGVLPRRSPPTPVPQPPPRGVGSATRTLALPLLPDRACGPSRSSQLSSPSLLPGPAMLVNNNGFSLPCSSSPRTFNQECYPRLLPRPHLDFLFVAIIPF